VLIPEQKPRTEIRTAIAALSVACIFWGLSFPATKLALQAFESHVHGTNAPGLLTQSGDSATVNGWRFVFAAALYGLLTLRQQRGYSRADIRGGLLVGAFFGAGMLAQLAGLAYTLPSISAFLTSLVVVFVPVAQALLLKRPVRTVTWMAVLLALGGSVVMAQPWNVSPGALPENGRQLPMPFIGETLTVLCAVLFAGQLLSLDVFGKVANTTRLTLIMMFTTAMLNVGFGAAFGGAAYDSETVVALFSDVRFILPVVANTLLASILAIHLMNKYQPLVTPAMASVIYCLEPVFATLFSILLQTESFSGAIALGGVLIVSAVLLVTRPARE